MAILRPKLKFEKGKTYIIDVSDPSNAGHPLRFTADSGATEYTTGVTATGTAGTPGATVTFAVPENAPNDLNYYCATHGLGMGNKMKTFSGPGTWFGDRAIVMGGYHGEADNSGYGRIEYFNITTTGNSSYFGEMHVTDRYYNKSCSNGTRSHTSGGIAEGRGKDTMEYVTIGTLGNAQDFGDLLVIKYSHEAVSDGTYGIMIGGNGGANNAVLRDIEYVTIATTGDGTDFGDLIIGRKGSAGAGNGTRALVAGGNGASAGGESYQTDIEYITMATPGNGTNFGDLYAEPSPNTSNDKGKEYHFCAGDQTRIVWASGKTNYNVRTVGMSYAAYDTPGTSVDFGDVTVGRHMGTSVDNASRGVFMGGSAGSLTQTENGYYVNTMDYITIQTIGDATDFGDLSYVTQRAGGASGGAAQGIRYGNEQT